MKGWTWVLGSTKWHYFDLEGKERGKATSLCKRWLLLDLPEADLQDHSHNSKDNCAACRRAVAERQSAEAG